MSAAAPLDDWLRHGVAIGDREALRARVQACCDNEHFLVLGDAAWPLPYTEHGGAADAVVRGMFEMVANHVNSDDARAAFAPLQLLVLLRGGVNELDAWVMPLDGDRARPQQHLMVLRPAVFTTVADRLLRAMTCAEVWPELGDLSTCQTDWQPEALANLPRDPERFRLGMHMAMLAALIVLYHEMAHILRGHSAYSATSNLGMAMGIGKAVLVENRPLGVTQGPVAADMGADVVRRALELDADFHAGLFVASVLKLDLLGEVTVENLPHWCEFVGFVATLTFNAFEAHAEAPAYNACYHLPSTRTECFLEGVARGLGVEQPEGFALGVEAGFTFCAQHYRGPAALEAIQRDIAQLQQVTQPCLRLLSDTLRLHVPEAWQRRTAEQEGHA